MAVLYSHIRRNQEGKRYLVSHLAPEAAKPHIIIIYIFKNPTHYVDVTKEKLEVVVVVTKSNFTCKVGRGGYKDNDIGKNVTPNNFRISSGFAGGNILRWSRKRPEMDLTQLVAKFSNLQSSGTPFGRGICF